MTATIKFSNTQFHNRFYDISEIVHKYQIEVYIQKFNGPIFRFSCSENRIRQLTTVKALEEVRAELDNRRVIHDVTIE